jgi:hypothetical protein
VVEQVAEALGAIVGCSDRDCGGGGIVVVGGKAEVAEVVDGVGRLGRVRGHPHLQP